jgi:cytochrome b6-f complex iron-sulfur subunit
MTRASQLLPRNENGKRRSFLLYLTSLALLYPIMRFAGYSIPKKPNYVKITSQLPLTGYLITRDFILFDKGDLCWALSRKCTHLGCKLHYSETKDILECPCHQSRFHASTGDVVKGPAKKPLRVFPVEKRENSPYYIVTT